ncbi:hypothetical protein GCK32_008471 [Trichostrongylus colubriformis]|uniref:Uncharacterized protein n=1 Tax=Trichostrongylus colubriformis TaxID=6319 RepID=A0AAN8G4M9_TRICO
MPVMAAVASGTERTVEGVANAILRVLLLGNATGDAVTPERAYLDPVNGMMTCDKYTEAQFKEHFGVACHTNKWREPDRSVMIAEMHLMKPSITCAMTQSLGEYNYAVGY